MTAQSDYQAYMLGLNPIAYWSFQGLAPGALHDLTGNGHDLSGHGTFTLNNVVPGFDGFEYADLDGTTAYFTVSTPASFNTALLTYVSLCFPKQANGYLLTTEVGVTSGVTLGVSDNAHSDALLGRIQDGGGAGQTIVDTKPIAAYGANFSLFGMTYDGNSLALTANGQPATAVFNPTAYVPGTANLHVGSNVLQTIFWKGGISDTAVFGSALPISAIQQAAGQAGLSIPLPAGQTLDLLNKIYAAVHATY